MIQGFQGRTDAVAVFVDGDNLGHCHAAAILDAAAERGHVTLRRVYGDLTRMPEWAADHRFAAQHASSVRGKNNADIRLVIDAMEHALAGRARVFVIASNDSDFVPLAVRLRELGFVVVGVGGVQAAKIFETACSAFIRMENEPAPVPDLVARTPVIPKIKVAERTAVRRDALDERIRDQILGYDKAGVMPLNILGSFLGSPKPHGASSWRGVIGMRTDRFQLVGKAGATLVRLLPGMMPTS